MVCKKCEKVSLIIHYTELIAQKTSTVATSDPFKAGQGQTRKIGENKLLTARARASPYAKPGASKGKVNVYGNKCIDCKVSKVWVV